MSLAWTLVMLAFGAGLCALSRWHEARPRELGEVPLFPSTLVLALGVLLIVLAAAHLITLTTGIPLRGRLGLG
jgi:hypothetical protein